MIPTKGDYGDWEQAAEVTEAWQAELMALKLRESGIEARVLDQSFRQEPLPSVRSFAVVRVLVPQGRGEDARRILERAGDSPISEHHSDGPEMEPAASEDKGADRTKT